MTKFQAIDLFSGCGGLSEGLRQAGFAVRGAIEMDALAVETYRQNHPDVLVWHDDIRSVTTASFKRQLALKKGALHLLAGCPPCQGFSRLRSKNGSQTVHDEGNELVHDYLRFVRDLLPATAMLENVPGMASDHRFDTLTEGLESLGYFVTYDVLDAADYGVPQRRKRLILLASRFGPIQPARKAKVHPTVRSAIAKLGPVGKSGDVLHDSFVEGRTDRVSRMIRSIPKDGGSRTDLTPADQLKCHRDCDGFYDVYGRMTWDTVAPTITTGCMNPSKGRFLHPSRHRTITLREAALLQSFPRRYWFPTDKGKYPVAQMIGNALPPEFIRRHAASIHRHLEKNTPNGGRP